MLAASQQNAAGPVGQPGETPAREGVKSPDPDDLVPAAPSAREVFERRSGKCRLVYNKATKQIDMVRNGLAVESFDPPEELG